GTRALGAQVRMPGAVARARGHGQCLAEFIGASQTTEVRAHARTGTRDEETHLILLCGRGARDEQRQDEWTCDDQDFAHTRLLSRSTKEVLQIRTLAANDVHGRA